MGFPRRRCCAPFPGYRSVAPVSAAPPGKMAVRLTAKHKNKRPSLSTGPFALFDAWQFPTLTWGDPTLPSALRRFTSEFGMGSGGTTALSPPGKFCFTSPSYDALINLYHAENHLNPPKQLRRCKVKPHGSLVSVSSTYRYAYTPDLSTSSSLTFLQET